jgi:hypothetical protein
MRQVRVLLWATTQMRAFANRSWSVIRSALPTVVSRMSLPAMMIVFEPQACVLAKAGE